jgi:hypothetical protein
MASILKKILDLAQPEPVPVLTLRRGPGETPPYWFAYQDGKKVTIWLQCGCGKAYKLDVMGGRAVTRHQCGPNEWAAELILDGFERLSWGKAEWKKFNQEI